MNTKTVGEQLLEIPIGWQDSNRCFIAKVLDDHNQRIWQMEESGIQPPTVEYVYVEARTFWDWLAEVNRPKSGVVLKVSAAVALVLLLIGSIFFMGWFHHFGADWAQVPVFITGIIVAFGCIMGFIFTMTCLSTN